MLHVHSVRDADCDTYEYVVVVKVMGRLPVSKRETLFDMKRFSLKKLIEIEGEA
jgi:hypothetical protein